MEYNSSRLTASYITDIYRIQQYRISQRGAHSNAEMLQTRALQSNSRLGVGGQGDYAGARQLQERLLEVITRVLGEEHPNTLTRLSQ